MGKLQICTVLFIVVAAVMGEQPPDDDPEFVCSQQGRFTDGADTTCRRYHLCSAGKGGRWVKTSYDCPDGTIFDGSIGRCSSTARCHPDSSESSSSESDSSDYDGDEFECKKPGLHDDVKDPYCSKYYECKKNHKGVLFAVQYPCPPPSKFDPVAKHCSVHYACQRQFKCSRAGRFEDGTDEDHKRYFLCLKKKNGDYIKTVYTCPLYSRFVQEYEACVVPDESLSSFEEERHNNDLPIEDWENLDSYKCKSRSYSANKFDGNSKSYYLCDVMADGKFAKYILACPHNYYWNEETNLCTPGHHP